MGGYICGDWEIFIFHRMACYVLTMNKCRNVWGGSNEGVDWMLPQFQSIKDTSVSFIINKMLQGYFGKVVGLKIIDAVGTSIHRGSEDDTVLNQTIDVLSAITCGGCNFQGENHILIYLNVFKHCLYEGRVFQREYGVTEMLYPTNISSFSDDNNRQLVMNFASVRFKTQVKALKHDGHICTFIKVMLASLLQHNKYLKIIAGEEHTITVAFI